VAQTYDAIVIGSGLGGLTAGALYARAGYRVLILERNAHFGGAATTYQHGPLTIEASLHETTDPHDPRDPKARIFRALGILDALDFVPVGDFYQVRGHLFEPPFSLPHGFDAARHALASRFPSHRMAFRRLFERIEAVQGGLALVGEQHDSWWWFLRAPRLPLKLWPLVRDVRLSLSEVFDELFGNDEVPKIALAANLGYYADDPCRLWWLYYAIAQGGYLAGGGAYSRGGSRTLSTRLVDVVEEEGGAAHSGRTVTDILLNDDGHAAGVAHTAADGSDPQEDRAPVLFGNAAPTVLADALPPAARDGFLRRYEGRKPSISLFLAALGLDRRPSEIGFTHYSTVLIPEWMNSLTDYSRNATLLSGPPSAGLPAMGVVNYSAIESGLNPGAPHLVSVVGVDRVANWEALDEQAYQQKRDEWLGAIIAEIDRTFSGFAKAVVQQEMATAMTMRRYLNTPEGALYGFAPEPPAGIPRIGTEKAVTTIVPGLWLASSFGGFGGFTGAMMTGALAARAALKRASRIPPQNRKSDL
jgi:phytoene dehydrogenase-like protein